MVKRQLIAMAVAAAFPALGVVTTALATAVYAAVTAHHRAHSGQAVRPCPAA